jgi:HEPN domain-containing protein
LSALDDIKRISIERWFIKAEHDLETANRALKYEPRITDTACFHAQQAAEKSLKAFLAFMDCEVEKTHDLLKLINVCVEQDASFDGLREILKGLTRYAIVERYPDDWREILLDEAQEVVGKAEKCMAFVKGKLKLS